MQGYAFSQYVNLTVKGRVSGEMQFTRREAYMFVLDDNEYSLLDSCRVNENTGSFYLEGFIPRSDLVAYLVIPPKSYVLRLSRDENIEIDIEPDTGTYPFVSGSVLTNESAADALLARQLSARRAELEKTGSGEQKISAQEELALIDYEIKTGRLLKYISTTRSPFTYRSLLRLLGGMTDNVKRVPDETIDSLIVIMKEKFPHDPKTRLYPDIPPAPAPSEESGRIYRFMQSLTASAPQQQPYKIGDTVALDEYDVLKVVKGLDTPYVLIDFWAKWCAPCMKEIPVLRNAAVEYERELTVLTVSLDHKEEVWKESVQGEPFDKFINSYLGNNSDKASSLLMRFGIKAIPANFLLDAQRRIIAVNLYGSGLGKKMKELCNE